MIVDLNEKELFELLKLVHMNFLDKRDNEHIDVTFEEGLEVKLVEALLKETGHLSKSFTPITTATGLQALIDEQRRLREEQK